MEQKLDVIKNLTMNYINELMQSGDVNFVFDNSGNKYGIKVLGRGTDLFFSENNRGLVCSIDAVQGIIYKSSIKIWNSNKEKMNKGEKERIANLIEKYYKQIYNPNARLE